jgi:AraC family carnitine catabolism transcriptional activator
MDSDSPIALSTLVADDDGAFTLSFLLLPEYAMVSLLSAIEPLRIANRLLEKEVFRWQCLSDGGELVTASNGMALQPSHHFQQVSAPRNLFVNASFHPERHINERTIQWLRTLQHQGGIIGALDTGCYLLAKARLLDHRKVTLHWEALPSFQERYPQIEVTHELFEIDGNYITCAGGTAASDMVLYLIAEYGGSDLAKLVCDQLIKNGMRNRSDNQKMDWMKRMNIHHPKVLKALKLMSENIENPLTTKEISTLLCISSRQLERLFMQYFKCTPAAYYLGLRVEHGKHLLSDSSLSVTEIALATGFSSTAHFSCRYKEHYGMTASKYRSMIK